MSARARCVMCVCALLGAGLLLLPEVWACPGCKEALFEPDKVQQQLSTARGYALSIGLMLLVPVGLIGGVTFSVVRASRRNKQASRSS